MEPLLFPGGLFPGGLSRTARLPHTVQLPAPPSQPFYRRMNTLWARQGAEYWRQPFISAVRSADEGGRSRRRPVAPAVLSHASCLSCSPCPHVPSPALPALQTFSALILKRCWKLLSPPSAAWLAGSLVLAAADVAWRRMQLHSYLAWREVPTSLLRLAAFNPIAWLLMTRLLDDVGPVGGGSRGASVAPSILAHLVLLAFASGAPKMAANALSLRVRLM